MPQEFTIRSSPPYRALDAVLPSAEALRQQQQDLILRRSQALQAIAEELRSAMAQGYDSVILTMSGGWRERALQQSGYEVTRCPDYMGADRFLIYFGQRDAADKATLLSTLERPDGGPAMPTHRPPSPPSPSVYARSMYTPPSPPAPPPPRAPSRAIRCAGRASPFRQRPHRPRSGVSVRIRTARAVCGL